MSIASQLTALQTDITNARTQITTMGGTITSGGGSSQLATDIATIPTGGSGDLPIGSTITVTSDEGATIEIERGTESQTLVVPSSGSVSFTVHQSGIWNITANKTGETELTDSVVVSADDTDYPVTMSFWDGYLYNQGNEYTTKTGGWVIGRDSSATLTKNATNMVFSSTSAATGSAILPLTFPLEELANFSTLNVKLNSFSPISSYSNYGLGIKENRDYSSATLATTGEKKSFISTISLSISSISSGAIWITLYYGSISIDSIWLE